MIYDTIPCLGECSMIAAATLLLAVGLAAGEPNPRAEPMVALLCPGQGDPADLLYHNKFLRKLSI